MTEENDLGEAGKDALRLQVTFIQKGMFNQKCVNISLRPAKQRGRGGQPNIKKVLIVKIGM